MCRSLRLLPAPLCSLRAPQATSAALCSNSCCGCALASSASSSSCAQSAGGARRRGGGSCWMADSSTSCGGSLPCSTRSAAHSRSTVRRIAVGGTPPCPSAGTPNATAGSCHAAAPPFAPCPSRSTQHIHDEVRFLMPLGRGAGRRPAAAGLWPQQGGPASRAGRECRHTRGGIGHVHGPRLRVACGQLPRAQLWHVPLCATGGRSLSSSPRCWQGPYSRVKHRMSLQCLLNSATGHSRGCEGGGHVPSLARVHVREHIVCERLSAAVNVRHRTLLPGILRGREHPPRGLCAARGKHVHQRGARSAFCE